MLNIFFGIAVSVFIAAVSLHTVGTFKDIRILKNISKPFLIFSILISHALIIVSYLPDSSLLLIYGSLALLFALAGSTLFMLKDKTFKIVAVSFFILSIISKLLVTFPSFRLYRFPILVSILFAVMYATGAAVPFLVFIKKKSAIISAAYAVMILSIGTYTYSAVLSFFGELRIYTIFLFLDSLSMVFAAFVKTKKEAEELSSPLLDFISIMACTASQIFFAAGSVMMQAL